MDLKICTDYTLCQYIVHCVLYSQDYKGNDPFVYYFGEALRGDEKSVCLCVGNAGSSTVL
jgi:hypothetical protein